MKCFLGTKIQLVNFFWIKSLLNFYFGWNTSAHILFLENGHFFYVSSLNFQVIGILPAEKPQETLQYMEMEIDIVSLDTMSTRRWRWISGLYLTFRPGDFPSNKNYFKECFIVVFKCVSIYCSHSVSHLVTEYKDTKISGYQYSRLSKCWSALATAPAETSAVAKVAIIINNSHLLLLLPLVPFSLEGVKLRF